MSPSNPYRRASQTDQTLSKSDKSRQRPVETSSKTDENISWQGFESAIQQQAKVANENQDRISINPPGQGTKRKARPSAEDWFAEHNASKAKEVKVGGNSSIPPWRRGSAIEQGDQSFNESREPVSTGLKKFTASRTASATDISKIPATENPYARRGRDRLSPPPTPVEREGGVVSPNMNPERKAMLEQLEHDENKKRGGGAMHSPAIHSPPFTQGSPPLSRRESYDGVETSRVPTGPRAGQKSANGLLPQSSRWEAKTKNLDRIDTRSASANAPFTSSMDVDPPNTSKSGSVTQSGNQTPISMTPATSALIENTTAGSVSGHNQPLMNQLVAALSNFSNHITQTASRTYQRDIAQKRQARLADEYIKNAKFHGAFRGLAEQQESSKFSAQNEIDRIDKKLKEQSRSRNSLVRSVADVLLSASSGNSNVDDSNRNDPDAVRKLHNEVLKTKTENVELNRILRAHEKEIAALRRDIANLPNPYNEIKALEGQVGLINTRLEDAPEDTNIRGIKKQGKALAERLDGVSSSLRKLKTTVEGDEGDEGKEGILYFTAMNEEKVTACREDVATLREDVTACEEDMAKFRSALETADGELTGFEDKQIKSDSQLMEANARITSLESMLEEANARLTSLEKSRHITTPTEDKHLHGPSPGHDESEHPPISEVIKELSDVKKELADVLADSTALRHEQEEKDDLVGSAIDAVSTSVKKMETELQETKDTLNGSYERISAQQESVSAMTKSFTQNLMKFSQALDVHRQALEQQQQKLIQDHESLLVCETACKHLDGRFNFLASDQLAKNMVNQLQTMYPYASNTQAGFVETMNRLTALETKMQEALADTARLWSSTSRSGVMSTEEMNRFAVDAKKVGAVETRIGKLDEELKEVTKDLSKLKPKVDNISEHCKKEFVSMDLQLNRINNQLGLTPVEEEENDVSKLPAGRGSGTRKRKRKKVIDDSDTESQYEDVRENASTGDDE